MPPMPSAAASRIVSTGKNFSSSQLSANGASFSAAKSRAMSRTAIWSSLRANSIDALLFAHDLIGKPVSTFPDHARLDQFIVGIENSAPSLTPDGQRAVTVLVLV